MNPSELLSPQLALFIIVGVIGFTFLLLIVLVRRWRSKTEQELQTLRKELRDQQTTIQQLVKTTEEFSDVEQEPYHSRLGQFRSQLRSIDQQTTKLNEEHKAIQERIRRGARDPFIGILGAPFFWYAIRRDVAATRSELQVGGDLIQSAHQTQASIQQLGWEIALQAREARGVDQQVNLLLDRLQDRHVHGEALDSALQQETHLQEALNQIPGFFLSGDKKTVLELADRDSIAQTHRILAGTRPQLDMLLTQVKTWEREYTEAGKLVTRMRRVLGGLESTLAAAPESLKLDEYHTRLDGLNIISQNLQATLSRLEVDSISAVIAEATRVQQSAQSMEIELRQSRTQLVEFEAAFDELNGGVKQLSALFTTLATSQVHPVVWDHSQTKLTQLSRQVSELSPAGQTRTVDGLGTDLIKAGNLNQEREQLDKHCRTIASQHQDLLNMLKNPEMVQANEWIREAQDLTGVVSGYAAANWPRADRVDTLGGDLADLKTVMRRMVFDNPGEPIPEDAIAERLELTHELLLFYDEVRDRIQSVRERLAAIQDIEENSRERLKISETKLNQISYLVASNRYLEQSVNVELKRLKDDVRTLNQAIDQSQRGTVEKKAKQVDSIGLKVDSTLAGWLSRLDKENQDQSKALSDSLSSLDAIAPITEGALSEARRLLSSGSARDHAAGKSKFEPSDMIQELKLGSDYWQECLAARSAIREIEEPITDAYSLTIQNREKAQEQLNHLKKWLGKQRGWPPTSVSIENEAGELDQLETQWKAIKSMQINALGLVQKLSDLAGKYQTLAEKIYLAGERISGEFEAIGEHEAELEEYARRWQALWRAHRYSTQADQEIRELIDNINQEFEKIKKDYKQKRIDYAGVTREMKLLTRRARVAQVSIDDSHELNIEGQVISFRG